MVSMTERAAAEITKVLAAEAKPDSALRIWIAGSGCSGYQYGLAIDESPSPSDLSFVNHGLTVLVDPMSHEALDGATIDFVDTPMGGGFKIDNPNSKSSCGDCNCDNEGDGSGSCGSHAHGHGHGHGHGHDGGCGCGG